MIYIKEYKDIDFEDWDEYEDDLHIYSCADTGMEGRDWYHEKYVLAPSRDEARKISKLSAQRVENWKSKYKNVRSGVKIYDGSYKLDEEEGYEAEKKKLEKKFKEAQDRLNNFNDVYNQWKKKNKGV